MQFAGLAVEFFLQIDNGRMAAARGSRRAARRRLSGLATPCFRCFTAYGAMPSHLALEFGGGPYSITALSCVVRHGKIGRSTSERGHSRPTHFADERID